MARDDVLTGTKWRILQEVAKAPQSASDLAKTLQTSIANVSQQLKLLEAFELVRLLENQPLKGPGKPKKGYGLGHEFATIQLVKEGFADRRTLALDKVHALIFNILFLPNEDDHYYLERFCYQNEEIMVKCNGLAFLKSTKDSIDLLYLTDDVEPIRKHYSNVDISYLTGKKKRIVLWTHNEQELREGLARMEPYFMNLMKQPWILLDTDQALYNLSRGHTHG